MPYHPDSEDALELTVLALLQELSWETVRAFEEVFTPDAATASRPYLGRQADTRVAQGFFSPLDLENMLYLRLNKTSLTAAAITNRTYQQIPESLGISKTPGGWA